ncbi:hypothetical protein BD779DRAFT_980170 [Infundibulicybe gibba]|nr:hypothetical protein BD779DRAFT_980170 [Infundibulicybe gibba]
MARANGTRPTAWFPDSPATTVYPFSGTRNISAGKHRRMGSKAFKLAGTPEFAGPPSARREWECQAVHGLCRPFTRCLTVSSALPDLRVLVCIRVLASGLNSRLVGLRCSITMLLPFHGSESEAIIQYHRLSDMIVTKEREAKRGLGKVQRTKQLVLADLMHCPKPPTV